MVNSILEYLETTSKKYPDKLAYSDKETEFSFSETVKISKQIASTLIDGNVVRKPVVIFMKKGVHNIVCFFASVYAGAYYVPIDMDMPDDRVGLILKQLKPAAVIYDRYTENRVSEQDIWNEVNKIKYEDSYKDCICFDEIEKIKNNLKTTDLLYVLFTSGSTGVPKGVTISHGAVMDFLEWICSEYELDSNVCLCNQAPFYFDASVPDIYIPIKTGASMFIPPKMYYSFPKKILQFIDENEVNTLIWVPSALCNVVNCNAFDVCVPSGIKLVIFCGEVMPVKHLNEWRKRFPDAKFVNMYGPTETTYACTYYNVERNFSDEEQLPLGKPCGNCQIVLLKEDGTESSIGESGEICVLGQCLSNGYYNNIEKTKDVFVQNPLNDNWIEVMYKTGDLARMGEDGNLIFEGRKDFQVKRLGYRIELGEIENALIAIPEIKQACCVFNTNNNDIVAVCSGNLDIVSIKRKLVERIPSYMLPTRYYIVEELPMNLNGKVDRVALKKKYTEGNENE